MNKIYTINLKNKTISAFHQERHYVIGFSKISMARKVHYSLHPEPNLLILRDTNIDLRDDLAKMGYEAPLKLDVNATIFIPKLQGAFLDPMNDTGYHIEDMPEKDFLELPVKKNLGIVMPYKLTHECQEELVFKAYVIDPLH